MSTTFKVKAGDTFASIARKRYGTEDEALRVAQANPGALEPLTPGVTLNTPIAPDAPQDAPQQAASDRDNEVAILINGNRFRFWDSVRITQAVDSLDTVEFGAPFEPGIQAFREAFRPFSFARVEITVGGVPFFTGTMVPVDPAIGRNQTIVTVGGYSLPGVLNDCTAPASAFPLEFDGQGLQEIATSLCAPFGLGVEFQAEQGAIFERVALNPGKKVLTFLAELAKQRNLIMSNTALGKLLFWQSSEIGAPVARLQQGSAPVTSVTPFFSPQSYYSHITGLEPVFVGLSGSQFTVKSPRLVGVIRPYTFEVPDTLDADVKTAVEAKAGRMFGNMAAYLVEVATWRDPSGNLWAKNTTVMLTAPGAMIYKEYEFVIRSIEFSKDRSTEIAVLNLAIPGSFSGKIPEVLPWDE